MKAKVVKVLISSVTIVVVKGGGMIFIFHSNENILTVSHSRLIIGQGHLEGENGGFQKLF